MTAWVIDASVAAKWFFPEEHSAAAMRLLSARRRLLAPDLLASEFGNILWKRSMRGEISADEARTIADDFAKAPIEYGSVLTLLPVALELAIATSRTVYDCSYLALALDRKATLVTADERMMNALAGSALAKHVRFVSSIGAK